MREFSHDAGSPGSVTEGDIVITTTCTICGMGIATHGYADVCDDCAAGRTPDVKDAEMAEDAQCAEAAKYER